jgi:flagellar biosynthetic protein FliR
VISFTSAEWQAWMGAALWPFLRVLGLVLAEPFLGHRAVPLLAKIGVALLITVLLMPVLPGVPEVAPASAAGALVAAQQLVVGLAMGFSVRVAIIAVEFAGQVIGMQMGLAAGVLFDPRDAPRSDGLGALFALTALLTFLSVNGHLAVIAALAESFERVPVGSVAVDPLGMQAVVQWAGAIFASGLLVALPVLAALLIATIAVGVLTRALSSADLFTTGFPVLLLSGWVALLLATPYLVPALIDFIESALQALARVVDAFGGAAG